MYDTPILLILFNRPENTEKVFREIRKQRPKSLYVAADGPRKENPYDIELCAITRQIIERIDWECKVKTLFNETNLGCGLGPATAISWFFTHVSEGIILEDDCIPSDGFFLLCEELLKYYKKDPSVMHITGSNLNDNLVFGDGSYYKSNYANVWGWATWRRAWCKFDLNLTHTDYHKVIRNTFKYKSEQKFWESRINLINSKHICAWDYQWMFSIWKEQGTCLNSNANLVANIGFGPGATHTSGKSLYSTPEVKSIKYIKHPSNLQIIDKAERAFVHSLHGIIRRGFFAYYLQIFIVQRIQNLSHKIKLFVEKSKIIQINEKSC